MDNFEFIPDNPMKIPNKNSFKNGKFIVLNV